MSTDDTITNKIHDDGSSSAASESGCAYLSQRERLTGAKPGDAVVVTKWIGLYGSVRIAEERYDELKSRLPAFIMENAAELKRSLSIDDDIRIADEHGDVCMYACGEGGLYAGLWELTRASDTGITAYLKDIPIRQETVEICEFYDINPYKLRADGSLIVVTSSPDELMKMYADAGIPSSLIGRITEDNERVLIYADEKKHIQKPARDELYKILW